MSSRPRKFAGALSSGAHFYEEEDMFGGVRPRTRKVTRKVVKRTKKVGGVSRKKTVKRSVKRSAKRSVKLTAGRSVKRSVKRAAPRRSAGVLAGVLAGSRQRSFHELNEEELGGGRLPEAERRSRAVAKASKSPWIKYIQSLQPGYDAWRDSRYKMVDDKWVPISQSRKVMAIPRPSLRHQ